MKARNLLKGLALILAAAMLCALPAAGLAADEVKVGVLGPMTGPGSLMGQGMRDGVLLAFDKVNQAGGIKGHILKPVVLDDQAQITLGMNGIKKLVYKDEVVTVIGTPQQSGVSGHHAGGRRVQNTPDHVRGGPQDNPVGKPVDPAHHSL